MLSIIIVNYHAEALIADCIRSVRMHNPHLNAQWIVVNNGSSAQGLELIKYAFEEVLFIEMGYNAGFARANNKGMSIADGTYYLLLNPDMLATDDSISRCLERMQGSNVAAAGVQLTDATGSKQLTGGYFMKGGINYLLPLPYYGQLVRWVGLRVKAKPPHQKPGAPDEIVDWISGAYIMVPKYKVLAAGVLDEDFFFICRRSRMVLAIEEARGDPDFFTFKYDSSGRCNYQSGCERRSAGIL